MGDFFGAVRGERVRGVADVDRDTDAIQGAVDFFVIWLIFGGGGAVGRFGSERG